MSFHGPEQSKELQAKLEKSGIAEEMSPAEQESLKQQMQALDGLFAKRLDATYKIEVQFGKDRSSWKPFPGAISFFLSGTKLHGGGDEKLYLCPGEGCNGIIFPNERLGSTVVCRSCEMMWPENDLVGELFFFLTPQKWAATLCRLFARFEHKADIYLKFHPTDIRYQSAMELARKQGGDAVNLARKNRGLHIYPLKNIIKDTSAGGDLFKRFASFITA
jgi:hypothetical protein